MGFLKRKSFWAVFGSLVVLSYVCVVVTIVGILATIQNRFDFKFSRDENISSAIERNLFSITEELNIDAELKESAVMVSGDAVLNQSVNKDVVFIGEKFSANAPINHNLYFVGEDINLNSIIRNDANGSARDLNITEQAEISGDANFTIDGDFVLDGTIKGDLDIESPGDITINGLVEGDTRIKADNVYVNGTLHGDLDITADNVYVDGVLNATLTVKADRLEISEESKIQNLEYDAEKAIITDETKSILNSEIRSINSAQEPRIKFDFEDEFDNEVKFSDEGSAISSFLAQVIFAMLILFFAKNFMKRTKDYVFSEPANAFKKGALLQLTIIGLIILGFISLIGIPVSLLIIALTVFVWTISIAIDASVISIYLKEKYADRIMVNEYILVLAIVGIWTLIDSIIPFSGFIAFIFSLIVFGGIYKIYNSKEIVVEAEVS